MSSARSRVAEAVHGNALEVVSDPLTLSLSLREREPSKREREPFRAQRCLEGPLSRRERDRVRGSDDKPPQSSFVQAREPESKRAAADGSQRKGPRGTPQGPSPHGLLVRARSTLRDAADLRASVVDHRRTAAGSAQRRRRAGDRVGQLGHEAAVEGPTGGTELSNGDRVHRDARRVSLGVIDASAIGRQRRVAGGRAETREEGLAILLMSPEFQRR